MSKRKVLASIPIGIVAILLVYSWIPFITRQYVPGWRHLLGLVLFVPIIWTVFSATSHKWPVLLIGIYLLIASFNLVSLTTFANSFQFKIFDFPIMPPMNMLSLLLLIGYVAMNFDSLVDLYLDHAEAKGR